MILIEKKKLNLLDQDKVEKFIKQKKPTLLLIVQESWRNLANSKYLLNLNENIIIQLNLINSAYKIKLNIL